MYVIYLNVNTSRVITVKMWIELSLLYWSTSVYQVWYLAYKSNSIFSYKLKSSILTIRAQAESIKNEMVSVESKVSRSEGLLSNLGSERERWQETSEGMVLIIFKNIINGYLYVLL